MNSQACKEESPEFRRKAILKEWIAAGERRQVVDRIIVRAAMEFHGVG